MPCSHKHPVLCRILIKGYETAKQNPADENVSINTYLPLNRIMILPCEFPKVKKGIFSDNYHNFYVPKNTNPLCLLSPILQQWEYKHLLLCLYQNCNLPNTVREFSIHI